MKIGVLSDTHLKARDEHLEMIVADHFHDAEIILHAGDIVDEAVLDVFNGRNLIAVFGNMDSPSLQSRLPARRVIEIGGRRIGLIHGWGAPDGIKWRIREAFEPVDCIVFGHTHRPEIDRQDGVLFFNPGSATDRRYAEKRTVGILTVGETLEASIIALEP